MPRKVDYDVIIIGAGNGGLTAALSAHESGANPVILEAADTELRGGNTCYAGGAFVFPHEGLKELRSVMPDLSEAEAQSLEMPAFTADEMYSTWMKVTKGLADPVLAETVITRGNATVRWLTGLGMQWSPFTTFAIHTEGKIKWQTGQNVLQARDGGLGLSQRLFKIVEQKGIEIRYETKATKLLMTPKGEVRGVEIKDKNGFSKIQGKAVILACGGYEANREMRAKYLGKLWEIARIRGTRYNVGSGIKMALDIGAQPYGHWGCCHGVLLDANASFIPIKEVGDSTNRSSTCYGILVNIEGRRFLDEGEDLRTSTYAKFGEAAMAQPGSLAFQIYDKKVHYLLEERYSTTKPVTADSIEELATKLGAPELAKTIKEFNAAVQEGTFDPLRKDGKRTIGINPPKSNWAMKIDAPPLYAYPVTGGITFTYAGLKINTRAQVLDFEDKVIPGLYAAGEIIGGLFYHCYLGGGSLTSGAVFGRLAGAGAAQE